VQQIVVFFNGGSLAVLPEWRLNQQSAALEIGHFTTDVVNINTM
jgi:hypothetical protein